MAAVAAANESDLLAPHLVALVRGLYLRVQAAVAPAAAVDDAAVAAANASDLLDPHLAALVRGLYLRVQATDAGLQPAAAAVADARPLDPRLLMAARRGDSQALKDLLQLEDDDDQHGAGAAAQPPGDFIMDVDHDDAVAAPPARQPPAAVPVLDEDGVTMEGDSLLHVVAACGDTQQFLDCAKMIVRNKEKKGGAGAKRRALDARNNKGDTPLHCAAGAGNAQMISCLAALITTTTDDNEEARAAVKKAFLRMQNDCGETALHQAIRADASNKQRQRRAATNKQQSNGNGNGNGNGNNGNGDGDGNGNGDDDGNGNGNGNGNDCICIDQLMGVDPELACIPHEDGASPLYLAISLGEIEIAEHLYVKSHGKLSYSGPDGRNVLHAAVHRGQALPMILKWLKDTKPNKEDSSSVSLVSQLTSQRDKKQKGSTPLHLAASLHGWTGAVFLCTRFPQVWPNGESMATLLLNANESTAYQADDEGSYPIHVAAWSNSIVVKVLLERCPDCVTLRDGKGRTFLHVATEEGHHGLVQQVVGGQIMRQPTRILNAQDNNGDTALHYAVRTENLDVFNCLLRNTRVRLDVANKDGMTPLDLSVTMIPPGFKYAFNRRNIVYKSLLHAGAPPGGGRPELFAEKHIPERDLDKESKKHAKAAQVMSIVTALIATLTFASAFTLPGGYRSADDAAGAAGTPVLAGSYAFDAFIVADTLAFICSIAATYFLFYVGMPGTDSSMRFRYIIISLNLMRSAARSLVAAFGLGLYLVVHNTASAIAACAIVLASSLYGNIEVWLVIRRATTVLARIGIRRDAIMGYTRTILSNVLVHFGSYIAIFGLPAIRKRVH